MQIFLRSWFFALAFWIPRTSRGTTKIGAAGRRRLVLRDDEDWCCGTTKVGAAGRRRLVLLDDSSRMMKKFRKMMGRENMIINLEVSNEIKIACIGAITEYLKYKKIRIRAIDDIIQTSQLNAERFLAVKSAIRKSKKLSHNRKEDIENLLDIIYGINTTTGTLYSNLLRYLDRIKTGWWIFNTGNSELKKQFYQVIQQYDAEEWDRKIIRQMSEKATRLRDDPTAENQHSREINYVSIGLRHYQEENQRHMPRITNTDEEDTESGEELISFLDTSRRSFEGRPQFSKEEDAATCSHH